jgi:NTE family protein
MAATGNSTGTKPRHRANVAVVLPGGGARGAYEIGALSVLLPALEARGERVSIWCGTSVGAINATALASLAHLSSKEQTAAALGLWRELRKGDVIARIAGIGGLRTLMRLLGHGLRVPGLRFASLLDPSPLAESLDRWIEWPQLDGNIRAGLVSAACVIATSLASGDPVAATSRPGCGANTYAPRRRSRCCFRPSRSPRLGRLGATTPTGARA